MPLAAASIAELGENMSNLVMPMATEKPIDLPRRLFRNDAQFRTTPLGGVSAGLSLKPTTRGAYFDRQTNTCVIVYVFRGEGRFVDGRGHAHQVAAGDVLQMPARSIHTVEQKPDGRWAEGYFVLSPAMQKLLAGFGVFDPRRPVLHCGVDVDAAETIESLITELRTQPDDRLPLVIARMHELLARLQLLDRHRDERLRRPHAVAIDEACRRIREHPERKVALAELAAAHGLSYERLRKLFRAYVGMSPNEYRISRRVDAARALLPQRGMSIKQVAYALGYPDPFAFSRQFKQVVGVSPKRFARQA